jgi:hypothetical protein
MKKLKRNLDYKNDEESNIIKNVTKAKLENG